MNIVENTGFTDPSSIKEIRRPLGNPSGDKGFGDMVKDAIDKVDDLQDQSNAAIEKLVKGESRDIHGTMIAMEKASISFELLMQVRNKVIDAYTEVKRMSI